MPTNKMAARTGYTPLSGQQGQEKRGQSGLTLVELMVGIAIGMLVVAVSMGALMVSRGFSGTVGDASGIQQQAAYAMRAIGMQLRQAGSLYLNPDPYGEATDPNAASNVVGFETRPSDNATFNPQMQTINGTDESISAGYRRYAEQVFAGGPQYLMANCLGGPNAAEQGVISNFSFNSAANTLECSGNGSVPQAIMQNVANFQVRYLLQQTVLGRSVIQYVDAAGVGNNWDRVQAIEVCLEIFGNETINMPAGSSYTGCADADGDGVPDPVDMTTLTGVRANRMHIAYRNVFQLRSHRLSFS